MRQHRSCKVVEIAEIPPSSLADSRKAAAKISRLKVRCLRVREYISRPSKLKERHSTRECKLSINGRCCCDTPWSFVEANVFSNREFYRLPAARPDSSCWALISNLTCASPGNRSLFAHMSPSKGSPFQLSVVPLRGPQWNSFICISRHNSDVPEPP